jgi:hypothetical protein
MTPLGNDVVRIGLDGNQLLVFLLGGIPPATNPPSGGNTPWPASFMGNRQGFVNSPTNPFGLSGGAENSPATGQQAKGPFFDFDNNRIDAQTAHFHDPYWKSTDPNANSLSVYYYFSSKYGNDYNIWGAKFQPALNPMGTPGNVTLDGGYGFMNPHVGLDGKFLEPNGYQIVSPGQDQVPSVGLWRTAANTLDPQFAWPGTQGYKIRRSAFAQVPTAPFYDVNGGGADDISNWTGNTLGAD